MKARTTICGSKKAQIATPLDRGQTFDILMIEQIAMPLDQGYMNPQHSNNKVESVCLYNDGILFVLQYKIVSNVVHVLERGGYCEESSCTKLAKGLCGETYFII